uniref:Uncharacterized protein n=1 Tax=Porodaedalea pini TaxID=108901 RepID=A0A5B9RJZ1_9AGAM|nr:hypothetical protein PPIT_000121 [Porodaedalea pini]QEG57017.1 hypothetical protein PPIT_000121 [Porodaedalea pini]
MTPRALKITVTAIVPGLVKFSPEEGKVTLLLVKLDDTFCISLADIWLLLAMLFVTLPILAVSKHHNNSYINTAIIAVASIIVRTNNICLKFDIIFIFIYFIICAYVYWNVWITTYLYELKQYYYFYHYIYIFYI